MTPSPPLDELVYRYLERVGSGEEHDRVLADLSRLNPDSAEALRRGVGLLRATDLYPTQSPEPTTKTFGPFRLQRRLGTGGMGIVYAAEQRDPKRRVALKLIRPDQLPFDDVRDRFAREIQSVARLSHPGIAMILESGRHDGVAWFSQELVVGASLAELTSTFDGAPARVDGPALRAALQDHLRRNEEPTDDQWNDAFFRGRLEQVAVRIVRQVAEALHHAHERGVLHRDVKSANVLLTPGGRAVLVDFGLASLRGTAPLTRTGMQIGTLQSMAPEQLSAKQEELGPHTDVYGAGLLLYELLTLRAPFATDDLGRLQQRIASGDASPVRKLNRAVGAELEAVCAKAMHPDPKRRYPSALELGRDLTAVLEHTSVAARPAGTLEHLRRWARRHPTRAVATGSAVLLLGVAPTVFGIQRASAARELETKEAQSTANLEGALQAIERGMRWTASSLLDDVPELQDTRRKLVEEALSVLDGLEEQNPEGTEQAGLDDMRATLLRTKADLESYLSGPTTARETYLRAEELLQTLLRQEQTPKRQRELGHTHFGIAQAFYNQGRLADAAPWYLSSLDVKRTLLKEHTEDAELLRSAAIGASAGARCLIELRAPREEIGRLLDEAFSYASAVERLRPDTLLSTMTLQSALEVRVQHRQSSGDLSGAREDLETVLAALEERLERTPRDRQVRRELAEAYASYGELLLLAERGGELATSALERSLELIEALSAAYPGIANYSAQRLTTLGHLADAHRASGRMQEALDLLRIVADEHLTLARADPEDALARVRAALDVINMANFVLVDEDRGDQRYEQGKALCDEAEAILGDVPEGPGPHVQALLFLGINRAGASFGAMQVEEHARALDAVLALRIREPFVQFMTGHLWTQRYLMTGEDAAHANACTWIERAVENGFSNATLLEQTQIVERLGDDARILRAAATIRERAQSG